MPFARPDSDHKQSCTRAPHPHGLVPLMWSQTEGRQLCRLVSPKCMTGVYPMATIGSHHYASDGVSLEYLDEHDHLPSLSEVPCTWGGLRLSLVLLVESPVYTIVRRLGLNYMPVGSVQVALQFYCLISHTFVDQNTNRQNMHPCISPLSSTLDLVMSRLE